MSSRRWASPKSIPVPYGKAKKRAEIFPHGYGAGTSASVEFWFFGAEVPAAFMKDELKSETCSRYMKALSVSERLKIVQLLQAGPKSVTEVAELLDDPIPNASHHLRILQSAGLVETERKGKFIFYSLNPKVYKKSSRSGNKLDFGCCRVELGKAS